MSKGSWRRPYDAEKFQEAWDKIFGEGSLPDLEQVRGATDGYRPSFSPSAEGSEDEPTEVGRD